MSSLCQDGEDQHAAQRIRQMLPLALSGLPQTPGQQARQQGDGDSQFDAAAADLCAAQGVVDEPAADQDANRNGHRCTLGQHPHRRINQVLIGLQEVQQAQQAHA